MQLPAATENFSRNQKKIKKIKEAISGRDINLYSDVISYPIKNADAGYDFQGGLIDSNKLQLIDDAILVRHGRASQIMPHRSYHDMEISGLHTIDRAIFFGGILFNNFGHFLLESISRLWAYKLLKHFDLKILMYAPWGIPGYAKKKNYVHQALAGLHIPVKNLIFSTDIVSLKTVIVPKQKYGFEICRNPDPEFMHFIRSFKFKEQLPKGTLDFDKVYVSRSELPFNQGRPFGEVVFEKYLRLNGYLIIHPEKHTLYEQLSIYKRAKKIIFCDGGATYATILLPDLDAEVAIIARRRDHRWNYKEVTEHFFGYKKPVLWIDEIISQYQFGLESWDAIGEIDWYKASEILVKESFVRFPFEPLNVDIYADLKKTELQRYIQAIQLNPLFIGYMEKLKEQHALLPASL